MPKPLPIPSSTREAVAEAIHAGRGRNEIARAFNISPGSVSKIARDYGLWFERSSQTATATKARQIDLWAARIERAEQLLHEYLQAPYRQDGTPTRRSRRASYALYDVERHHDGTYRS
ncbi:hypothetical protein [Agromyces albus]|uniref:hypothetical protein n=1 Tax=Agromyces albus TaxID=205332 RepID=UPI00278ACAE6|nr:hypothetical protein [Agromyces albus]MDQ0576455.1 transposase-like protein [Agromyces albus]